MQDTADKARKAAAMMLAIDLLREMGQRELAQDLKEVYIEWTACATISVNMSDYQTASANKLALAKK